MSETVRCWLVHREYTDKGLVTLVYATTTGDRKLVEQRSANQLGDVTAGRDVDADRLVATDDDERDRFGEEATRMADRHDPDERV